MLVATDLTKEYPTPRGPLSILDGISFSLSAGDGMSIVGPSGSGKSTLLYIAGGLEPPSRGAITLGGRNPFTLDEKDLAAFRNQQVGFIFQDHCLLPQLSVLENVLIPTLVGPPDSALEKRARDLLAAVGLKDRIEHRPAELSGGEKQRVAMARALIRQPLLLLCDEPTGSLDRDSADTVASLLLDLHQQQQTILIVVTHSAELARKLPQRFELRNKRLEPC